MAKTNNTGKFFGYTVGIVVVLAVLAFAFGLIGQTQIGDSNGPTTDPAACADSSGILTVNVVQEFNEGTAVSGATVYVSKNGGSFTTITSGTSTFAIGSSLDIFVSKDGYIDQLVENQVMECGGSDVKVALALASPTNPSIRIKNDDGDFMTDAIAGGAINQTAVSAGETIVFDVEFTGTNLESTGDLIYVIELGSSANVSEILMAGATSVAVPSTHVTQTAGSKVVAYSIPAIDNSAKKTYSISVALTSGKTISGGVYTDVYAKQAFIDDDGTVKVGVQDSTGDAKYENTQDSDFFIN